MIPGYPAVGPARIVLLGWLYCWAARWWMTPTQHRRLIAGVLKNLNRMHRFFRIGHRWCMRLHVRTFTATLKK